LEGVLGLGVVEDSKLVTKPSSKLDAKEDSGNDTSVTPGIKKNPKLERSTNFSANFAYLVGVH
jgi:hypothetical protein